MQLLTLCLGPRNAKPCLSSIMAKRKLDEVEPGQASTAAESSSSSNAAMTWHAQDTSQWASQDVKLEEAVKWEDQVSEEEAKPDSPPRRGFADLRQDEKDMYLRVPDSFRSQIGMRHKNPHKWDGPMQNRLRHFLARYKQSEIEDHQFEMERDSRGKEVAVLTVPSFSRRRFRGAPMPVRQLAKESSCVAFFEDPEVREVARRLPPTITQVKRHVTMMLGRERKEGMLKKVAQELVQEFVKIFKDMGCRTALWDGNA